jgi:flagellar motility protein MotE (MotC chaperone)
MKKIEDNLLEDLFYSIMDNRKEREPSKSDEIEEVPEDLKDLEKKKRARYEALKEKYKD